MIPHRPKRAAAYCNCATIVASMADSLGRRPNFSVLVIHRVVLAKLTTRKSDGSSVGLFGVRAFTLSQQKRRAESRRSVRPALSELFVCGAASDPDALRLPPSTYPIWGGGCKPQ